MHLPETVDRESLENVVQRMPFALQTVQLLHELNDDEHCSHNLLRLVKNCLSAYISKMRLLDRRECVPAESSQRGAGF